MRQGKKPKPVTLFAEDEFELARGIILPAGRYEGLESSSAFSTMKSNRIAPSRFELIFTTEQMRDLGVLGGMTNEDASYNVTQQVSEGILVVE